MLVKTTTRQIVCNGDPPIWFSNSAIGQCSTASSSRTILNFDEWSPEGCLTTPLPSSVLGTRSASVSEMSTPRSPSKPPSKGLNFLKARLKNRRYSDSPEKGRAFSRSLSPLLQQEATASADSQFVNNLLQDGKHITRFQKRIPSTRTAVRKYEGMIFRQRFMGLPEEVRNKVYDYVIAGDAQDEWTLLENCGAGFADCSRGVISLATGTDAGVVYLDNIPILLQSRSYGAQYTATLSSHTSCASPSISYGSRSCRAPHTCSPILSARRKEPWLQSSSKNGKLRVYHVHPIPTTWPKYVRKGDILWNELMRRWSGHEDAKVYFEDQLDIFSLNAYKKCDKLNIKDSGTKSDFLFPLFEHIQQGSVRDSTILQQVHNLHLALTLHEIIPWGFPPPRHIRADSPFSIHQTKNDIHPLAQAAWYIASSLAQLTHLTSVSLTLTLYPGPLGDTTSHGYDKYFTTLEELDGLWYILGPLKSVQGMETIIVRRLGACVRWGRKGSSLFPAGDGVSIVETEGFPSDG